MVKIQLPDGNFKEFEKNPNTLEVAASISERLAQDTIAGKLNGEIIDFRTPLNDGDQITIITKTSPEANEVIRHSAAHVMAQAVQELWPDVKVTIGPVIENGFYYDFDSPFNFTEEHLVQIEKQMKEVISRKLPIQREVWDKAEAISKFDKMGEKYKVELIENLPEDEEVGVYTQGDWLDLCRGPHIQHTGQIKAFKVLYQAGSYWRGDENREQLQRVYATAFSDKKELKQYLLNLEEAKKRDHRKLGKELKLFTFNQLSPGAPFFSPRGAKVYNLLQELMRDKYEDYGYEEVITPQIFDVDLYHQSGHYDNYQENMYFTKIDDRDFSVKPMNCPGHCVMFAGEKHSYRDLPLRIADFGRLHRYERSGVMHGLTRVRTFCQDDAHIFCTQDQLQTEIERFVTMLNEIYETLGMTNYKIFLATRPEKRVGSEEIWDRAEASLEQALKNLELDYGVNEGDGAFYGPKLDIVFTDAIGRPWQLGTLQCDFNMPERFQLKYTGADGDEHRPVMLHRAILGSLERFIGVYLEHTAGKLPTWLCPEQVAILNVTDNQAEFCEKLVKDLKNLGVRAIFDSRNEKLGFKIREAQLRKVPYMLTIGDKEVDSGNLSVRNRLGEVIESISTEDFKKLIVKENKERSLELSMRNEN
ncbi:MAG: threonine--tRNA ligase [Bdellovibrionaceae bacterium]|nr:threonine--tRNA ligase [Pseudobdellovibrionaceae bacterium]|tara:strand:- start:3845 stop:5779 length:1935 start_codon:yes stop_codon:yes gene_type:complete